MDISKPLHITRDVSLQTHSTMRLGGSAAYAVEVSSVDEVRAAHDWAATNNLPYLVVGSGSNIVWRDSGFRGLLIVNRIRRFEMEKQNDGSVLVRIGAGENWDEAVARCAAAGLSGIEALSYIPGTAGATPVQNVGAYGQDISQTLVSVEAYDTVARDFTCIPAADCAFGYRTSRFKTADRGRFIITGITLRLTVGSLQPPFYAALQAYIDEHNMDDFTPQSIRQAVIAIRSAKLPDPRHVANNGSFFANPVISQSEATALLAVYPSMSHWPVAKDTVKLSAAWLIEQSGFKDYHDPATGMATWLQQPLVLVNEHAGSTADLLAFRQKLLDAVREKFGIQLEQEPELLPQKP